ncbi:MAG: aldo/keto reductase [Actinobacteria bacterium]|nr:aldo/keto reductase [Actinomycetota bacterium]
MQYTQLGRSGLKVSRLILGTMNIGWTTPADEGKLLLDRGLELGINVIDTANMYGGPSGPGATETIIGEWFAQGGDRREKTVLATKLHNVMAPFGSPETWPNESKLSALHIRRACEASLKRLQTDYIDLYQMHHVDRNTPWEEIWEAFSVLRQEGKVLYFGSSNFAGWHLVEAQAAAKDIGMFGLVSEQSMYSLLRRTVELEVLPASIKHGIGVIPWSPLTGGLLGGVLRKEKEGRSAGAMVSAGLKIYGDAIAAYESFCDELGHDPADVALAWLLHQPGVTAPIIGPRTVAQLDNSLRALDIVLDESALTRLDEIFPGPGGAPENGVRKKHFAPEAYAW